MNKQNDFILACEQNNLNLAKSLINCDDVEANWNNSCTLYSCVMRGHLDIVKLLIENGADPSYGGKNDLIKNSSVAGNIDIVSYLLSDERVDPTSEENYAITFAHKREYIDIVKLLWNDKRVKNTLKKDNLPLYNQLIKEDIKNKVIKF